MRQLKTYLYLGFLGWDGVSLSTDLKANIWSSEDQLELLRFNIHGSR